MKRVLLPLVATLLAAGLALPLAGQEPSARPAADLQWQAFPDAAKFAVRGLPWFGENQPKLWRMPATVMDALPKGVQNRARMPSGGRIHLRSTTARLGVRTAAAAGAATRVVAGHLDAAVNGRLVRSAAAVRDGKGAEFVFAEGLGDGEKDIVIYLPHLQEIVVTAIGLEPGARVVPGRADAVRPLPVVYYGSSVCQGSGAQSAAQTYPAIASRELRLDFINLGFGGSGKAEPEVVRWVNSLPGCAYVFDLGKSYGAQDASAFLAMLRAVRRDHPSAPIIVITPITSAKEVKEPAYAERSVHTRKVMRDPAQELIRAGDTGITILEGEAMLGFKDHHLLSKDGVHPADEGYRVMAARLVPVLRQALGL